VIIGKIFAGFQGTDYDNGGWGELLERSGGDNITWMILYYYVSLQ